MKSMIEIGKDKNECYNNRNSEIIMSPDDLVDFENSSKCKICHIGFGAPGVVKCRDHSHEYVPEGESNYRGGLCGLCDIRYRHPAHVTIVETSLAPRAPADENQLGFQFQSKTLLETLHGQEY